MGAPGSSDNVDRGTVERLKELNNLGTRQSNMSLAAWTHLGLSDRRPRSTQRRMQFAFGATQIQPLPSTLQ